MRRSALWLTALLVIGCSGSDDGDDDGITPGGPGTLTLDAYDSVTNLASFSVSGTKKAGAGVEVDGTVSVPADSSTTFTVTLDLTNGLNTFSLVPFAGTAKGPAVTVTVTLDNVAPTLTDRSPMDGATDVPLNAQIVATFSEALGCASVSQTSLIVSAGGSVTGQLDCTGSALTFTPSTPLPATQMTTVTILGEVADAAGNSLGSPVMWSFTTGATIDETPPVDPTITMPNPIPATTQNATLMVTGTKEAAANVEARWSVDGTMRHDYMQVVAVDAQTTWMHGFPLENGLNLYTLRSRDGAGNVSCDDAGTPCTVTFMIMKEQNQQMVTPPTVQFFSPTDAPQQVISGTKAADTGIAIDGNVVVPVGAETTWTAELTVAAGANSFQVTARDGFGNDSTAVPVDITYNQGAPIPTNAGLAIEFELSDMWNQIGDEFILTVDKKEVGVYAPVIWLEGPIANDGSGGHEPCVFDDNELERRHTRYVATVNFLAPQEANGTWVATGHWWEPNYFVPNFFAALVEDGQFDRNPNPIPVDVDRRNAAGNTFFWEPGDGACPPTWYRQGNGNCRPIMDNQPIIDAVTEASVFPDHDVQGNPQRGNLQPLGSWTTTLLRYPRDDGDDPQSRKAPLRPGRRWDWTDSNGQPIRQGTYLLSILFVLDRSSTAQAPGGAATPPYQWLDALRTDRETCWDNPAHDMVGSHRAEGLITFGTTDVTMHWNEKGPVNETVDACHNERAGVRCTGPDACDFNENGNFEDDVSCPAPNSDIGGNVVYTLPQGGWPAPVRIRYCASGQCP